MKWVPTSPAAEGWYWLRVPGFESEIALVMYAPSDPLATAGGLVVYRVGTGDVEALPQPAEWAGPIDPPV